MLPWAFTLVAASLAVTTVFSPADVPPTEATRSIDVALTSLSPSAPDCEMIRRGVVAILDAMEQASERGDAPHRACGARAAVASLRLARGSLVDPAAVALMDECHRGLHDGTPFAVPKGVKTQDDAIDFITRRLRLARQQVEGPRPWEATSTLLDAVLMIMTPVERENR